MCTIIAITNPNPHYRFFFFASRDRPIDTFYGNYLKFFPKNRVLGIYDNRADGLASGYSLKTKIYVGVANVSNYKGAKSRGTLVKKILTEHDNIAEAVVATERELIKGDYSSGIYLLGKDGENWLVENFERTVYTERLGKKYVLTNFFTGLKVETSKEAKKRSDYVRRHLLDAPKIDVGDVMRVVMHHSSEDGVCRHGLTLASLFVAGTPKGKTKALYQIGENCQGMYNVLDLYPELRDSVEF